MRHICAWCLKELRNTTAEAGDADGPISHGMCAECLAYFRTNGAPLSEFLNKLGVPVLAVDGNAGVLAASDQACKMLGKKACELDGLLAGDAFECAYARRPGGCGRTIHCKSCAIRITITDTYATARSYTSVPAYPDLCAPEGVRPMRFLISTQKLGDLVLLRIDDITAP